MVEKLNAIQLEKDGYMRHGIKTNDFENQKYDQVCKSALTDRNNFWLEEARDITWRKKGIAFCEKTQKWFDGWQTNLCYNCVDRHIR